MHRLNRRLARGLVAGLAAAALATVSIGGCSEGAAKTGAEEGSHLLSPETKENLEEGGKEILLHCLREAGHGKDCTKPGQ